MFRTLLIGSVALAVLACSEPKDPVSIAPPPPALDSPSKAAPYLFSRSEQIDRLVEKLVGQGSSASWNFAKTFIKEQDDPELSRALIRFFERCRLNTGDNAGLRTTIQVMSSSGLQVYAQPLADMDRHPDQSVRDEAMKALIRCASPEVVDDFVARFQKVDVRRRSQFMRIFALKLEPVRAVPLLRAELGARLSPERAATMQKQVLRALEQPGVPKELIRGALKGFIAGFPASQRLEAAKLLHKAGGAEGRVILLRLLEDAKEPDTRTMYLLALAEGEAPEAVPLAEALSDSDKPTVLMGVASFFGSILARQGEKAPENLRRTLEFLAEHESPPVRQAAVRALGDRGRALVLPRLEASIRNGSGTELREAIEGAIALQSEELIPVLIERLQAAKGPERRIFLQGLGRIGKAPGIEPLVAEFLAPPVYLQAENGIDSVSYAALMLGNIPSAANRMLRLYAELGGVDEAGKRLPKSKQIQVPQRKLRRSLVRNTLALLAQQKLAPELKQRLRQQFLAQVEFEKDAGDRMHALSLVKAKMKLADLTWLVSLLRAKDQDPEFARRLNDFLWEYF
ncbi:MAG: hypothetical protein CSA62_14845 [Planctomycetota bacterium]|nr:MAG: hypothetical protein CSA62_14845 [Planctomycetota bacterium]